MTEHPFLINLSYLFSQPTGLATYANNLYPYLKSLDPTLLISQSVPDFNCYPVPSDMTPAQGTKGNIKRLLWTQFQLAKIYQTTQASLLFSPIPEAPIYTACRYIITVHDLIPLRFPQRKSLLTLYFKFSFPRLLAQAEHILCNSQATADDLKNYFGISASKMTPTLLAYDQNHFYPYPNSDHSIPYFLYIGRPDPHKNLYRLITAFANLPNYQTYQLWIAGKSDPRYTPILKQQVSELGITEQVKFLDYVSYDALPKLLNNALALVFPSLWEGFGLPVLEAMACGTPVITSNLSSLSEVSGNAALLINPYQTTEITDAMNQIATDEKVRSQLQTFGLQRAKQFSWSKTAQETIEVLSRYL
ncbi:mannosyltransferase [Aphanothece hegewaldii CCALA 016]|uniref:Mannosyltransferase n=2 Tax=Aphanothece TaxID=1121 RepID=A0A2T1M0T5_9CHRO|nr:glycosyltransferase family 1 protein [Aphanothece hegewaldii]PSF38308.1 mannosyltransferase [Aphanothece hegewaldii CCALA 016]